MVTSDRIAEFAYLCHGGQYLFMTLAALNSLLEAELVSFAFILIQRVGASLCGRHR
jgi:hypothetical protein